MCISPQRRAKCSRTTSFLTFSLPNVLLATAACIFSTSELTKVLRTRHVLYIFTSKCTFRHSGVQFWMSPLSTYLCTRRFNRPTFRLTRHTNHWKNTAFRDFSNISRRCIFFLLTFALVPLVHLLPSDLTACLSCFSTVHIVGSLLFKLPSTRLTNSNFHIGLSITPDDHWASVVPVVVSLESPMPPAQLRSLWTDPQNLCGILEETHD